MKPLKLIFLFVFILFVKANSQSSKFTCNSGRIFDQHGDNLQWNNLVDSACTVINKGDYEAGYKLLAEAVYLDSVASGGNTNQYVDAQFRKLGRYIDEMGSQQNADAGSLAVNESKLEEHDKQPESQEKGAIKIKESTNTESQEKVSESTPEPVKSDAEPTNPVVEEPKFETPVKEEVRIESKTEVENRPIEQPSSNSNGEPKKEPLNNATNSETSANVEPTTAPVENTAAPVEEKDSPSKPNNESVKTFTPEEKKEFEQKGMSKVHLLETFIQQISNKNTQSFIATQAIENAIQLFDSEERIVEVSSLNSNEKRTAKIRKYLNNLKLLNYDEVDITWADFNYASEFRRAPDGTYQAYISFVQRFTGKKDGVETYSDITEKRQLVILKSYKKTVEGEESEMWDVLLGDISVEQTSPK
jgi:hypothetical protein